MKIRPKVDKNLREFRLKSTVARLKVKKFGGSLNQLEERVVLSDLTYELLVESLKIVHKAELVR